MRYAVIENEAVANIASSSMQLAANWAAIPIGMPVAIGDAYSAGCFYAKDGTLRITPEQRAMQTVYEAAYAEGVQQA